MFQDIVVVNLEKKLGWLATIETDFASGSVSVLPVFKDIHKALNRPESIKYTWAGVKEDRKSWRKLFSPNERQAFEKWKEIATAVEWFRPIPVV